MLAQNPHIFYTDDDEDDLELFRGALADVDDTLILITADDGEKLLQLLEAPPPVPRLIFLDLNMPRHDGYEVLEKMRSNERLRQYPVVVFSTASDEATVNKTRAMGANLYVVKPYTYNGLKDAIRTCVNMDWSDSLSGSSHYMLRFN